MECRIHTTVPGDHPSLAGHFPGNPVVPAVVILDRVLDAVITRFSGVRLVGFPVVKFISPLGSDTEFVVSLSQLSDQRIRFECAAPDGTLFAKGQLDIGRDGTITDR